MSLSSLSGAIACSFPLFILGACTPDQSGGGHTAADFNVSLLCEQSGERDGIPYYAVYTVLNDSKVKLAEINACDTILPADYTDKGIPKEALTAVGGWYAGFGDYVYAVESGKGVTFHLGGIGEGQDEPMYSALATYIDEQFQILRPLNVADLAGYYTNETSDSAFVLFVGMQGDTLTGKLFGRSGELPARQDLLRELGTFGAGATFPIDCILFDLRFFFTTRGRNRSLGTGSDRLDLPGIPECQYPGRNTICSYE